MPAILDRSWPWSPHPAGKDDVFGLPHFDPATIAGISVAIVGNVLISFALNCQKLAHRRLELQRELEDDTTVEEDADGQPYPPGDSVPLEPTRDESEPLLPRTRTMYNGESPRPAKRSQWYSRLAFWQRRDAWDDTQSGDIAVPVDVVTARPKSPPREDSGRSVKSGHTNESDYLKSKLWWTGFTLMNIGEIGNFISYGFAPASVVAPLGTFALVANCIFAPLMLKERFRKRDFLGVMIAIVGAVTVVLSANPSDTKFDTPALLHALAQKPFIVYAAIYVVGAVILSGLSEGQAGEKYVFVDVGLCAIFGGFTVLSTKAFSSLLTREGFEVFTQWITYPILAVLVGTGVGQIRYLNRALMRFDSKIVVPAQFVTFNLSAILGSAILYQDFRRASFHQIVTFLYGCGATFVGVFLIAWAHGEENGSQDEGAAEDIEADTINGDGDVLAHDLQAGGLGRRPRATLVIPETALESAAGTPILRNRRSVVSMIGFSPAQRLLLVHSSPREERGGFPLGFDSDAALDGATRRRTMSLATASEIGSPTNRRDRRLGRSTVASRQNSRSLSSVRVAQDSS
ncbi:magnesium transporter NIPA-domain-containing protein [Phanerochaete sordida]|uniref:Magnesium transporter NIPA-domain-containing protein n=1 Tax=Phanerochaete sordida TaxID=48140 RepID=A0A9P3L7Y0_9APHY|nr:magnesium transporter NIPA-domain-containing protein [Phanerochaete sordida]